MTATIEPLILVTGATGDTGRYTVERLLRRGRKVRAFVHADDDRAAKLRALGAEVVFGDLLDLDQVRAALDGVTGAYFVYPIQPGLIDATAFFAQAAKEAGVEAIVNMSQISARRDAVSHAARNHWIAERVFDWSGLTVTHIRPTLFAQWLLYRSRAIAEQGVIRFPFGDGRHAPIAAEDQAKVIVGILENPAGHGGKTYPLHGPVELDHHGIADALGRTIGRDIRYEPVPIEAYRKALEATPGLSPHFIQHISAIALDYQNGFFAGTNDVVERVGGEPPMTVEAFAAAHADAFRL